jgi:hypothetical protein
LKAQDFLTTPKFALLDVFKRKKPEHDFQSLYSLTEDVSAYLECNTPLPTKLPIRLIELTATGETFWASIFPDIKYIVLLDNEPSGSQDTLLTRRKQLCCSLERELVVLTELPKNKISLNLKHLAQTNNPTSLESFKYN